MSVQGDSVLSATVEGGELSIGVDRPGLPVEAAAVARVRGPDGEVDVVSLRRVASGRFEGEAPADTAGAYWITAVINTPDGGMTSASVGAVSTYQEEFSFLPADPALAQEIRRGHRWKGQPAGRHIFRDCLPPGGSPIWQSGHGWWGWRWCCSLSTWVPEGFVSRWEESFPYRRWAADRKANRLWWTNHPGNPHPLLLPNPNAARPWSG